MTTIPICLVSGFLGSGKTSFLQHTLETSQQTSVYLVNEFAPNDVDGSRLELPREQLVSISGGSIFCTCLVQEFIKNLQTIADAIDNGNVQADGVIVEASGAANPRVVYRMLEETGLDKRFHLACVISLVDPHTLHKLLVTLPAIRAQIEAAHHVIINKSDMHDEETLNQTRVRIQEINPQAVLWQSVHGCVSIPPFETPHQVQVDGVYTECGDPNFFQTTLQSQGIVNWSALEKDLKRLCPHIYRMKGSLDDGSETGIELDFSADRWDIKPQAVQAKTSALACIASPTVERSLENIRMAMWRGVYDQAE